MMFELFKAANLSLFDGQPNTNVTTDSGLSPEMKTYYDMRLIDLAQPLLVHDQFGQKRPIPQGRGKTIEFRKYTPLSKATTALTEGVTPDGKKLSVTTVTATVKQYGDYVTISDVLSMTAIDDNLTQAQKLLANQAGLTLDTITRDVLNSGTNVQHYDGTVAARANLVGGDATPENNHYMNVRVLKIAARALKTQNTPLINGTYVGIIHPDVAFDLTDDPEWKYPHQYVDTEEIYSNEIGKVANIRFVETTEAKKFVGEDLASDSRTLAVNGASVTSTTTVPFDGGTVAANALVGRQVNIGGVVTEVTANTASSMTVADEVTAADNTVIYPGEGGKEGRDVYSTLILGENAYGVTEVSGGGLEFIVKQLGSSGTADPLNQRATAGWKAIKTAEILVDQYMIRVETTGTFNDHIKN